MGVPPPPVRRRRDAAWMLLFLLFPSFFLAAPGGDAVLVPEFEERVALLHLCGEEDRLPPLCGDPRSLHFDLVFLCDLDVLLVQIEGRAQVDGDLLLGRLQDQVHAGSGAPSMRDGLPLYHFPADRLDGLGVVHLLVMSARSRPSGSFFCGICRKGEQKAQHGKQGDRDSISFLHRFLLLQVVVRYGTILAIVKFAAASSPARRSAIAGTIPTENAGPLGGAADHPSPSMP